MVISIEKVLALTYGLLKCMLLMSIELTNYTAIQVATPALVMTTALTPIQYAVCLRNNYIKKKLKNVSMINFKKSISLTYFCFIFNYIYKHK